MRTFLAALLLFAACSKSESATADQPAKAGAATAAVAASSSANNPAKAREMIAAGAVVIDVRTPGEFSEGHLKQATNIPVQEFAARIAEVDKLTGGDKTRPVVLHCRSGRRSAQATTELQAAGYTNVVNGGSIDDLE